MLIAPYGRAFDPITRGHRSVLHDRSSEIGGWPCLSSR